MLGFVVTHPSPNKLWSLCIPAVPMSKVRSFIMKVGYGLEFKGSGHHGSTAFCSCRIASTVPPHMKGKAAAMIHRIGGKTVVSIQALRRLLH